MESKQASPVDPARQNQGRGSDRERDSADGEPPYDEQRISRKEAMSDEIPRGMAFYSVPPPRHV